MRGSLSVRVHIYILHHFSTAQITEHIIFDLASAFFTVAV